MNEQKEKGYQGEESSHVCTFNYCQEDNFSLFFIWCVMVRQWKLFCVIIILTVFVGVNYIIFVKPVYESQAIVKKPESKYVYMLNITDGGQVSDEDIFANFITNCKSRFLQQHFYDENPQFLPLRGNLPNIREKKGDGDNFFLVSFRGNDPKLVADWINNFIPFIERKTLNLFFDSIETKIVNKKKEIENQLRVGREFAGQRRQDRIALLENQIAIARAAKIFDRQIYNYSVVKNQKFGETLDVLQGPMYMRGVKLLAAEKKELEKRTNDDPFIAGLRDKQEQLAQMDASLNMLRVAITQAHVVTVEQQAIKPKIPLRPRRLLVLILSVVVGGVVGIIASLLFDYFQQNRKLSTK